MTCGAGLGGTHPSVAPPYRAAAAACANSPAEVNRRMGSLAIAVAITASIAADSPGTRSLTVGGGWCR
ncbi:Uncharacterised protein [Mycobacterium tuberculosis]|uniref:Uncharacterized protein n=1 Tax=Mycobacterium tuberculosis TaxID=1773 RepID=A0A0U0R3P5_MYCTX|nr:Uncharacterised protein [Mycobacterium tuberculosis]CPB47003.1 Uncharacterised protein [Mycobacterium tuberculosis]